MEVPWGKVSQEPKARCPDFEKVAHFMQRPSNLLPLGESLPADRWQTHVNSIFYGIQGPGIHNHFQTYVSRDHRLAHALADEFFEQAKHIANAPIILHEWGVGNGNLAACFLGRLKQIDADGLVYPKLRYLLCDYSLEILKGARAHPRLQEHKERFDTIQITAGQSDDFEPGSVDKIISNEIWDDLATKVILKHQGIYYEEHLQPFIDPAFVDVELELFCKDFNDKNLTSLSERPPFLPYIYWERSFPRTQIEDWPHSDVLKTHLDLAADEIPIPVNTGAFLALERARIVLKDEGLGYTGMDYGMFSMNEVNTEGRPYFNLYGGQYTNMVNFPLLVEVGKKLGFQHTQVAYQHQRVSNHLNMPVVSVLEIVQEHPQAMEMEAWDRDVLMLETLHALGPGYNNPYPEKLKYPPLPDAPKKQKKRVAKLAQALKPNGVPDTVAYITETEVHTAFAKLRKIGYREKDLQRAFNQPPAPISFIWADFK